MCAFLCWTSGLGGEISINQDVSSDTEGDDTNATPHISLPCGGTWSVLEVEGV